MSASRRAGGDGGREGAITQVELSSGDGLPAGDGAGVLYVLLRWKGRPVGRVVLHGERMPDPEAFRSMALEAAAPGLVALESESAGEGHPFDAIRTPTPRPLAAPWGVSVVVATRDRPEELRGCLEALGRLDPGPAEIVVVDSASKDPAAVERIAAEAGARRLRLDRPGLSLARNAGAAGARGSILAFLDDDTRVDPGWLDALCRGFADTRVDAVTGLMLPEALDTRAQVMFLRYTHMDRRGFVPRRFHLGVQESVHWPLDAWRMGSGGNLAVRRGAFDSLGGFRTTLGLGTPSRGGEDLFLLWSLIRSGRTVAYRPDALAWHRHHRTADALRRMLYGYGVGHAAYLEAVVREGVQRGTVRLYRLGFYADRLLRLGRCVAGVSGYPASLVLREVAGSLVGRLRGGS